MSKTNTVKVDFLSLFIRAAKLPAPVKEFRFHPERRWRFDFCWPDQKLALEVDGGLFIAGRHSRGAEREKDMEKLNTATILGWRVLLCSPRHVNDGRAVEWIKAAMGA